MAAADEAYDRLRESITRLEDHTPPVTHRYTSDDASPLGPDGTAPVRLRNDHGPAPDSDPIRCATRCSQWPTCRHDWSPWWRTNEQPDRLRGGARREDQPQIPERMEAMSGCGVASDHVHMAEVEHLRRCPICDMRFGE